MVEWQGNNPVFPSMKLKHIICALMASCSLVAAEEPVSLSMFKELAAAQKGNVLFSPACFEAALLHVGKQTHVWLSNRLFTHIKLLNSKNNSVR